MPSIVRDVVLSWWGKHPDPKPSSGHVAAHFNTGPGRATLPAGSKPINPGTLRNWKRRHGDRFGLTTGSSSYQRRQIPALHPHRQEPGSKLHDLIRVPDPDHPDLPGRMVRRSDYIVELVSQCRSYTVAAKCAGVTNRTLINWRRKGKEQEEGIYRDFLDQIEQAKADAESTLIGYVVSHAASDGNLALKALGRFSPDRWAERRKIEQTHLAAPPGAAPLEVTLALSQMTPEQLKVIGGVDLDELGAPSPTPPEEEP